MLPGNCLLPVRPSRLLPVRPSRLLPVRPSRLVAASPRGRPPVTVAVSPAARGFAVRPPGPVPLAVTVWAAPGALAVPPRRRLIALPLIPVPAAGLTVSPGTHWFVPCRREVTPVTAWPVAASRLSRGGAFFAAGGVTFYDGPVTACGLAGDGACAARSRGAGSAPEADLAERPRPAA